MHAFYFSYFVLVIGGPVFAVVAAEPRHGEPKGFRGPEFDCAMGSMVFGFLCAYVWYPWIAARGPFENEALVSSLPPFEGGPFTSLARWITDGAAVSGNCFPSAHVAGTWGVALGVAAFHRKGGWVLILLAVGVSISCVYTRYHHGVDVPAGIMMGVAGAMMYRWLSRQRGLDREHVEGSS
jgi:membrane-associated phospholipid phosphatase